MPLKGVTIVICTHNGSNNLPVTLEYIANQKYVSKIKWEVIVVDNASIDNTTEVASNCWPKKLNVPFKVVEQPIIGLIHARIKGFSEARYEFVSFIDDDNWIDNNWVKNVYDIMSKYPQIGACGSLNEAAPETTLPIWFNKFQRSYAVGIQEEIEGDVTNKKGVLFGAGLTIRKTAWEQIIAKGFKPLLVGRQANKLTSGEDYEICLALRLNGWKLWYDSSLKLKHYLPAYRLSWSYLKKMLRIAGYSSILLDPYYLTTSAAWDSKKIFNALTIEWIYQAGLSLVKIVRILPCYLYHTIYDPEGKACILEFERLLGRTQALLIYRRQYDYIIQSIEDSKLSQN